MSEVSDEAEKDAGKAGGRGIAILSAVVAAVVIAAVLGLLYVRHRNATEMAAQAGPGAVHEGPLARYATASLAKLKTWKSPHAAVPIVFDDAAGKPVDMASFKGKVVVMNIWATWCGPCVVEMPTLADVQRKYPNDVAVVAVSEDRDSADAKNFIDVHDPLAFYHDPDTLTVPNKLGFHVLPSTVIFDRHGREVARIESPAAWNSPEAYALIDAVLKRP
ncbi:MAG TPA: TlpA disulfide reductase family protein [Caulobacteraceae bacterium]|jgi:thiol-disulfide isomerase/thioredoxin